MVKVVVVLGTTGYASLGLREADRKQQSVLGQEVLRVCLVWKDVEVQMKLKMHMNSS